MQKLILSNHQSPGDIVMMTAAVRDLHLTYPGRFATDVRTSCPQLWEHNPYLTPLDDQDREAWRVDCHYPLINRSNELPYHFIHGFRQYLNEVLGLDVRPHAFHGDLHVSDEERGWLSQVDEATGTPGTPFWIIVSGGKRDFTAKWWDPDRCQAIVDHFKGRILFAQVGDRGENHVHPPLRDVIDLVGKTDLRQLVRLVYHARGVVCPVTLLMHAAAAVPTAPGRPARRPCVVVAGGREPTHWEAYPSHQYLHAVGCLPCCASGGCWRSRVRPLGDGDEKDASLCERPVTLGNGRTLPKCLHMITAAHVIDAVERYLAYEAT